MRKTLALIVAACLVALTGGGCTPKPVLPDPVAEQFLAAVSRGDFAAAGKLTDSPDIAAKDLAATKEGLQAENINAQLVKLNKNGMQATAEWQVTWDMPKQRSFSYSSYLTLSKTDTGWLIRWQPKSLYPKLGQGQHLELRAIGARRASIVAADGSTVLVPGSQWRVLIDPTKVKNMSGLAIKVANALAVARAHDPRIPDYTSQQLAANVAGAKGPYSVVVALRPSGPLLTDLLKDLEGVTVNEEAALITTDPSFAPDIMERVKTAVGATLEGEPGWFVGIVNSHGALIDTVERHEPAPAPTRTITLDRRFQDAAQRALEMRGTSEAAMVVVRPSTGEILAIAQTKPADQRGPIALTGQYPPGSTFKMITAAAGMIKEGLNPDTPVPCPGHMDIGHRIVNNYNGFSLGTVPMWRAFASSCNTSFADMSSRLKPGELKEVGAMFGLGRDYDIPGLVTMTGSIPRGVDMVDRTEAGFGQGKDLASPFGLALVAATAATGHTPTPVLIKGLQTKTKDPDVPAPPRPVIDNLQRMMLDVTQRGTARGMRAKGEIRGKTGEAEINGGSHAWFAGYRNDDIAFATLVVLGGGSEISVAITDRFFQNLDAPPPPPPGA